MIRALACALLMIAGPAMGHPFAKKQTPDDNSNAAEHAMAHLIIGIGVSTARPNWSLLAQWGACQIPGAIHELSPSPGNSRSNRDLLFNAAGCALGVAAGHGFWFQPARDGVTVGYAARF